MATRPPRTPPPRPKSRTNRRTSERQDKHAPGNYKITLFRPLPRNDHPNARGGSRLSNRQGLRRTCAEPPIWSTVRYPATSGSAAPERALCARRRPDLVDLEYVAQSIILQMICTRLYVS